MIDVYGPEGGRESDIDLLRLSGLDRKLEPLYRDGETTWFIYGDPAYSFAGARHVIGPYRLANPTPEQEHCNMCMSSVRVSVENAIGSITNKWCALDFVRQEKTGWSAIGLKYLVAVILSNFMTCVRGGNQISDMFGIQPPTLEGFLGLRD